MQFTKHRNWMVTFGEENEFCTCSTGKSIHMIVQWIHESRDFFLSGDFQKGDLGAISI